MPLDPSAKRFLAMTAAASPRDRSRPSPEARRQALAKLMQFARADVTAVTGIDGVLPGPGGGIPYRLYAPADAAKARFVRAGAVAAAPAALALKVRATSALAKSLGELRRGETCARHQQYAAGIAVETVDDARPVVAALPA